MDELSFHLIHHGNNDVQASVNNNPTSSIQKKIYAKLYSICSNYNQLGDQYIFSEDLDELKGIVFTQRFNIIMVGKTGSGKSTFINRILGEKRCLVCSTIRGTEKIVQYHHSKYPLSFYDTQGFEKEKEINNVIKQINSLNTIFQNKVKQIHLILYLINSETRMTDEHSKQFFSEFDQWRKKNSQTKIPFVFILTKSKSRQNGKEKTKIFADTIKEEYVSLSYQEIFPIEMGDKESSYFFGIKELMQCLYSYFNQFVVNQVVLNRKTYFLSQMINNESPKIL